MPPPQGVSALIDPSLEDPTDFLELDLGGQLPNGDVLAGTFEFLAIASLSNDARVRADFTIEVLGLNREVIRASRANAYSGFRARLREYVDAVDTGADEEELNAMKSDLLKTPHLTVFFEMRRQRAHLPGIREIFLRAPEILEWPLSNG